LYRPEIGCAHGSHGPQRAGAHARVLLGAALRRARGTKPVREIAAAAGVAEETLRKIERGAVPTPALFTVAAITQVLGLTLDDLVHEVGRAGQAAAVA